jgi:hypothetical protein
MLGTKRMQRENEEEQEQEGPLRKRHATPAARGNQGIIAFDASLSMLTEYNE